LHVAFWVLAVCVVSQGISSCPTKAVEVNIMHQLKQTGIGIDQKYLVTALKDMTGAGLPIVDPGSVPLGYLWQTL